MSSKNPKDAKLGEADNLRAQLAGNAGTADLRLRLQTAPTLCQARRGVCDGTHRGPSNPLLFHIY